MTEPVAEPLAVSRAQAIATRLWLQRTHELLADAAGLLNQMDRFPQPDGDTGANADRVFTAVWKAIEPLPELTEVGEVFAVAARAAVLGARGNCGMIVAQFLRGMSDAIPTGRPLEAQGLARAISRSEAEARGVVAEPVEGTMLTVLAAAADDAEYIALTGGDLVEVAIAAQQAGTAALQRTTDQLPVLAGTGLVDAGAAVIVLVLNTWAAVVSNTPAPTANDVAVWLANATQAPLVAGGQRTGRGRTATLNPAPEQLVDLPELLWAEVERLNAEARLTSVRLYVGPGCPPSVSRYLVQDLTDRLPGVAVQADTDAQQEWLVMLEVE